MENNLTWKLEHKRTLGFIQDFSLPQTVVYEFPTYQQARTQGLHLSCANYTEEITVLSPEDKVLDFYTRVNNLWQKISVESRMEFDGLDLRHVTPKDKLHYFSVLKPWVFKKIEPFMPDDNIVSVVYALNAGLDDALTSRQSAKDFMMKESEILGGVTPVDFICSPEYDRDKLQKCFQAFLVEESTTPPKKIIRDVVVENELDCDDDLGSD